MLALVGNAAELFNAVRFARKDQMDLCIGITVGASAQVALLVAPVLVFMGMIMGQNMDLIFSPLELIAIVMAIYVTRNLIYDGESNWLEGLILIGRLLPVRNRVPAPPGDRSAQPAGRSPGRRGPAVIGRDRLDGQSAASPRAITMLGWLEIALGLLIWSGAFWDGFATIVLPRTVAPMKRLSGRFNRWSWRLWAAVGRRIGQPELKLSFLAVYGPISVMVLLFIWAMLMIVAFAMIYHGLGPRFQADRGSIDFGALLYMSGSTFLTLGLGDITSTDPVARSFMILEAGMGYTFLGLIITYMPLLDQAYGAREVGNLLIHSRRPPARRDQAPAPLFRPRSPGTPPR